MKTTQDIGRSANATPWRGAASGLCALLIGVGLGRFSFTPMIPALVQAGWFSAPTAVYLGSANLAGYLLDALAANRAPYKIGAVFLVRLAMAATTASFFASAINGGFGWMAVWRFAAGVSGALLMVLPPPMVLACTPEQHRGRIGGVLFTGVALGIILSGTAVPWLATAGVVETWIGLGILAVCLTAIGWSGWPVEPSPSTEGPTAHRQNFFKSRNTALVLLLIAYAGDAVGFVPHTVFLVDYVARGLGRGLAVGGLYWVLFGAGAVMGAITTGYVAERLGFSFSLTAGLLIKGSGVLLAAVSTSPPLLALSSFVVGALTPGVVTLASGRVIEMFGPENKKRIWGWMTASFAAAQAGAAYGMSYAFGFGQAYRPLFAAGAAALFVAAVCFFASGRQRLAVQRP